MDFEELLLEEIITIVKEAKDENFMRIDLKYLLSQRLEEFSDAIEDKAYEAALDEINGSMKNLKMTRGKF